MLGWDLDCWRWVDGFFFLKYTMKFGRDSIISMIPDTTRAAVKWQGYFLGNYWFYWSQVWDLVHFGKEAVFMWFIWRKAVVVNEWRACITSTSISK